MLSLTYIERSDNGRFFEKFVLFTLYRIDLDNECLSISVNPVLKMFILLKQYKHTRYT